MKIKRIQEIETNSFIIGDILSLELSNGEKHSAIAIKESEETMLFIMRDMFDNFYKMNNKITPDTNADTTAGILSSLNNTATGSNFNDWNQSDLRKTANSDLLELFPKEIKEQMMPFDNGDFLQPPANELIVGNNAIPYFSKNSNRLSMRKGKIEPYWLKNTVMGSYFTYIKPDATIDFELPVSGFIGFRPVFMLKNESDKGSSERIDAIFEETLYGRMFNPDQDEIKYHEPETEEEKIKQEFTPETKEKEPVTETPMLKLPTEPIKPSPARRIYNPRPASQQNIPVSQKTTAPKVNPPQIQYIPPVKKTAK